MVEAEDAGEVPASEPDANGLTRRGPFEVGDRVLFDPEDKGEVEIHGELYVAMRERDVHAVAAERLGDEAAGLYL